MRILHDEAFVPHFVLRVTEQTHTQSCITKPGVTLVNGTSLGPEIRMIEGQIVWIRVYNEMDNQNLTMVGSLFMYSIQLFSDRLALARPQHGSLSVQ